MKKITTLLILFISFQWAFAQEKNFVDNQLIVKFIQPVSHSVKQILSEKKFYIPEIDRLNKSYGLSTIKQVGNRRLNKTFVLSFAQAINVKEVVKQYLATGSFEYVEPNYIGKTQGVVGVETIPNDQLTYPWQWSLHNDGTFPDAPSTVGADISMDNAWDIQQGSSAVIVAILDSGAFLNHPEFAGRIWVNPNEVADGTDSDGNGLVDDINGWDFAYGDNTLEDVLGHGTNVSGIIGAQGNNAIGYAGVDWNCKLMNLKVLEDDGFGYYTWWADAIYYAVDNGAKVINMSLAGSSYSSLLEDAVNYAYTNGVTVVASTGNQNSVIQYPAKYDNSLAIGATNPEDQRANPFHWGGGSNFGVEIDLVAPGDRVYGLHPSSGTNYSWFWSGTSQASPHVSGVISLLLAENPTLIPSQIRTILINSAEDEVGLATEDTPGFDNYYGYGRLNAEAALNQAFLGLEDTSTGVFSLYPNPVENGTLFIHLSDQAYTQFSVFDVLGKELLSQTYAVSENTLQIDLSAVTQGVYFVKVTVNDKTAVKRFIMR